MKKTARRTRKLALDREAIRNLTPETLRAAAGGTGCIGPIIISCWLCPNNYSA